MWCWLSDGIDVWIGMSDSRSSGGWTNCDCWEDFDRRVKWFWPIMPPDSLPEGRLKPEGKL